MSAREEPWLVRMAEIPDNPETMALWEELSGMHFDGLYDAIAVQSGWVHKSKIKACAKAILFVVATAIDNETTLYDACRRCRIPVVNFKMWQRNMSVVAAAVETIEDQINARVEHEIYDRAVNGWDEDVYHQGDICGIKRVRSHDLLKFHAQASIPKYAPKSTVKQEISGPAGGPVQVIDQAFLKNLTEEELAFLEKVSKRVAE